MEIVVMTGTVSRLAGSIGLHAPVNLKSSPCRYPRYLLTQ